MSGRDAEHAKAWAGSATRRRALLETMRKPAIASINGFRVGGGCELVLACDIRYASARANLGQPEINLAIVPR